MGARLVVRFGEDIGEDKAPRVYLHNGGEYVEDATETVVRFTVALMKIQDPRWSDPEYLAAKMVVWAAQENTGPEGNPLDFLSVGVTADDAMGDALAVLECDKPFGSFRIEYALDREESKT